MIGAIRHGRTKVLVDIDDERSVSFAIAVEQFHIDVHIVHRLDQVASHGEELRAPIDQLQGADGWLTDTWSVFAVESFQLVVVALRLKRDIVKHYKEKNQTHMFCFGWSFH